MTTEPMGTPPSPEPTEDATPAAAPADAGAVAGEGTTWIADTIVAKIAGAAAREVEGVSALRAEGGGRGWGKGPRETEEASVTVADGVATVDLRLVVTDGVHIPTVVDEVRSRVARRVEDTTGIRAERIDIGVVDVITGAVERTGDTDTPRETE